jgi:hypothetical protein
MPYNQFNSKIVPFVVTKNISLLFVSFSKNCHSEGVYQGQLLFHLYAFNGMNAHDNISTMPINFATL